MDTPRRNSSTATDIESYTRDIIDSLQHQWKTTSKSRTKPQRDIQTFRKWLFLILAISFGIGWVTRLKSPQKLIVKEKQTVFNSVIGITSSQCDIPDFDTVEHTRSSGVVSSSTASKLWCSADDPVRELENNNRLVKLLDAMHHAISENDYVGLSAIYLGAPIQILIYENTPMFNARIKSHSETQIMNVEETPLEPGKHLNNLRYESVVIQYIDMMRTIQTRAFEHKQSRQIQMLIHSFVSPTLV
ncbi:MAG: peptide deformylase [Promethearchaeota archaeon]